MSSPLVAECTCGNHAFAEEGAQLEGLEWGREPLLVFSSLIFFLLSPSLEVVAAFFSFFFCNGYF